MTRTSRLASSALAISLAILPAAAFAQQTTAPTTAAEAAKTPAGGTVHPNAAQPADAKAPAHAMKTETHAKETPGSKEATPPHAKLGTAPHAAPAPAKTVEPGKS
jgi:hypothetical protein